MKKRYLIYLIFCLLSALIGAFDPIRYEITEAFLIITMIPKWIWIILILVSLIYGIYISISLLSHKTVIGLSKGAKLLRLILWIPVISFGNIAMIYGFTSGSALLINRLSGEQKIIVVSGQVIDSKSNLHGLKTSHMITVLTDNLESNRRIDFKVPNKVDIGTAFYQEMTIGSLGLLYKK